MMILVVSLSPGCSLKYWAHNGLKIGPNYVVPNAPTAEQWLDSPDQRVSLSLPQHVDWWSTFHDPILNELIEIARTQNLTLHEAGWRIQQARDVRRQVAGSLFPQVQQADGGYTRSLASRRVAVPSPVHAFDNWSIGAGLAWEVDVWGRFRRSIAAADATVEVAEGDYDFVLLSLIADVADAYNIYRVFEQRLRQVRANIEIQEGSLRLAQVKADEGKTGYTSVSLAKTTLANSRALEPQFEAGLRLANNALCILIGVPTEDLTQVLGPGSIPMAPTEVAVGIPADLLRRRPDIRAAERAIAAQSESIGIALTDLYPTFSIAGNIGWAAEDFGDLLKSSSNTGTVGPNFRWNILNYGRILANVDLQESGLQELIVRYQNAVLTANREVEDALVTYLKNQERVEHLKQAVRETSEALRLVVISYEEGERDFTGVYVLQEALVINQDSLVVARGDVVASLIDLYKALGGGWEVRCPNARRLGIDKFAATIQPDDINQPLQPIHRPRDPTPATKQIDPKPASSAKPNSADDEIDDELEELEELSELEELDAINELEELNKVNQQNKRNKRNKTPRGAAFWSEGR